MQARRPANPWKHAKHTRTRARKHGTQATAHMQNAFNTTRTQARCRTHTHNSIQLARTHAGPQARKLKRTRTRATGDKQPPSNRHFNVGAEQPPSNQRPRTCQTPAAHNANIQAQTQRISPPTHTHTSHTRAGATPLSAHRHAHAIPHTLARKPALALTRGLLCGRWSIHAHYLERIAGSSLMNLFAVRHCPVSLQGHHAASVTMQIQGRATPGLRTFNNYVCQ